jgi:hypothetical protein
MGKVAPTRAETTKAKHKAFLEGDVFPWIGSRPITELPAPLDVLPVWEHHACVTCES